MRLCHCSTPPASINTLAVPNTQPLCSLSRTICGTAATSPDSAAPAPSITSRAGSAQHTSVPVWQLLVGGFLVGYGARLGNGCTSGHGICGLGALQLPSLGAVLTFMATAFLTANLMAIATKGLA